MWIQPVSAIHILGAGVGLFGFQAFAHWHDTRRIGAASLGAAVFMLAATLAIVAFLCL
jgi:hypothetical protein